MSTWTQWLRNSLILTGALTKQCAGPLVVLFGATTAFTIWAEDAMQLASQTHEQRWDLQIGMGVTDLISGVVLILLLSRGLAEIRQLRPPLVTNPFAAPFLGSFIAEYLRMLAQILLYGMLLILPGIYRCCQLIFVPYIAIFSKRYREGDLDAIRASERLSKGQMLRIFAALSGTMALSAFFEFAPHLIDALEGAVFRAIFYLLADLTSIWGYALLFLLFESAIAETRLEDL